MNVYPIDPAGYSTGSPKAVPRPVVPGDCVITPPPALDPGEYAVWQEGAWHVTSTPPAAAAPVEATPKPTLVLSAVTTTDAAGFVDVEAREVTCHEGSTVSATAELKDLAGETVPLTGAFRMPIRARDGREFLSLVTLTAGVGTASVVFSASGIWAVTEELLNSNLPPAQQLAFAGLQVFVVQ